MKKILAVVSSRDWNSQTLSIINKIKENFTTIDSSISFEVITPKDYNLNFSDDPRAAFLEGTDINEREEIDDSKILKNKMEEAALVILASPTYFANVSADMKLFIDRFCHLAHLFYFAKKPCMTVVTSDGNGHTQTSNYLKTFSDGLGMVRLQEIISIKSNPISDEEIKKSVEETMEYLNKNKKILPNMSMEMAFQHWKKSIAKQNEMFAEYRYWESSGMFTCNSLEEYFEKYR
jgi:multimeric flavodoxin WrbA